MERTLVLLKPSAIQRSLIGEVIGRFEKKGLQLIGIKMMQLDDSILSEHYAHLSDKPFFNRVKAGMMITPIIVTCWQGVDAVEVVRKMTGPTNGRNAQSGTIRGDFSMSIQENIIHTSDSVENATEELNRFFAEGELFEIKYNQTSFTYTDDELE